MTSRHSESQAVSNNFVLKVFHLYPSLPSKETQPRQKDMIRSVLSAGAIFSAAYAWKVHAYFGSYARCAVHLDIRIVDICDMFYQRQSEPGSSAVAGSALVHIFLFPVFLSSVLSGYIIQTECKTETQTKVKNR